MRLRSLKGWTTKAGKERKIRRYQSWKTARRRGKISKDVSFEEFCETWEYCPRHSRRLGLWHRAWMTKDGKVRHVRLYSTWSGMRRRCSDKATARERPYYYDKGIRVCQEWQDFDAFREWALANGYRKDMSIDRINSDEGYCPDNCEWVTKAENGRRAAEVRWA